MHLEVLTSSDEPVDSRHMSHPDLFQCLRVGQGWTDLGLYIHVPFCRKRCHFCAFYLTVHREDQVRQFLHALEQEIALWGKELGKVRVSTVYLGGGTPTSLTAAWGEAGVLDAAFALEQRAGFTARPERWW